ncbi:hypothetical protein CIB48_g8647 [Xylaria polymorpha]|nr:hypothetical protein CIB48_g8647 [Xylaria polymorpha]
MPPLRISEWRKLPLSLTELCIDTTLRCGQSFRWQKINDEWNCVLHGRLLSLKQDESALHYKVTWPKSSPSSRTKIGDTDLQQEDDTEALLGHYFNLRHDLAALYDQWSELDPNFKKKAPNSQASAFSVKMPGRRCHDSLSAETGRVVRRLNESKNPGWAATPIPARDEPITYRLAHEELLLLSGVGPKVSDCVCLMGLGWSEAVPVDTHVWQIAQRDYRFGKSKTKTFSKAMYHSIGDHFRQIWGPQAGWAQSVLFTANLKSFAEQAATDPKTVEVAVEIIKQEITSETPNNKKRRTAALVEQIKIENDETLEVKTISRKRRKTRS